MLLHIQEKKTVCTLAFLFVLDEVGGALVLIQPEYHYIPSLYVKTESTSCIDMVLFSPALPQP
jgi:hypothetical protein